MKEAIKLEDFFEDAEDLEFEYTNADIITVRRGDEVLFTMSSEAFYELSKRMNEMGWLVPDYDGNAAEKAAAAPPGRGQQILHG